MASEMRVSSCLTALSAFKPRVSLTPSTATTSLSTVSTYPDQARSSSDAGSVRHPLEMIFRISTFDNKASLTSKRYPISKNKIKFCKNLNYNFNVQNQINNYQKFKKFPKKFQEWFLQVVSILLVRSDC